MPCTANNQTSPVHSPQKILILVAKLQSAYGDGLSDAWFENHNVTEVGRYDMRKLGLLKRELNEPVSSFEKGC